MSATPSPPFAAVSALFTSWPCPLLDPRSYLRTFCFAEPSLGAQPCNKNGLVLVWRCCSWLCHSGKSGAQPDKVLVQKCCYLPQVESANVIMPVVKSLNKDKGRLLSKNLPAGKSDGLVTATYHTPAWGMGATHTEKHSHAACEYKRRKNNLKEAVRPYQEAPRLQLVCVLRCHGS